MAYNFYFLCEVGGEAICPEIVERVSADVIKSI